MSAEQFPPASLTAATHDSTERSSRGPGRRLRQAIQALAGGHAQIEQHGERNWASITFAGTRHRLDLLFSGDPAVAAGERLIAELPDHEFALPGQLVADATVVEVDHGLLPHPQLRVVAELLLLEDS